MTVTAQTSEQDVSSRSAIRALCPLIAAAVVSLGATPLPGQVPPVLAAQVRPALSAATPCSTALRWSGLSVSR